MRGEAEEAEERVDVSEEDAIRKWYWMRRPGGSHVV